jgi:hypothetical protein
LLAFSSNNSFEVKLYDKIFSSMFPQKAVIKVWSDSDEKVSFLTKIPKVVIVNNQNEADILFVTKQKDIVSQKMKFVTSYQLLKKYRQSAVGGFYWKKGRPNILFLEANLNKYNISLPKSFNEYIESY